MRYFWIGLWAAGFLGAFEMSHAQERRPGESRSSAESGGIWDGLRAKYDEDGDGVVGRDEYPRGLEKFLVLDVDRDGKLTTDDFEDGRRRRRGVSESRVVSLVVKAADGDDDGQAVSREEWNLFLESLDVDEASGIDREALLEMLPEDRGEGRRRRFRGRIDAAALLLLDRDGDGVLARADLKRVFVELDADQSGVLESEEIERIRRRPEAPEVGEVAPDFELPYAEDASKKVVLSSFRGKRPVALVFGSYT